MSPGSGMRAPKHVDTGLGSEVRSPGSGVRIQGLRSGAQVWKSEVYDRRLAVLKAGCVV